MKNRSKLGIAAAVVMLAAIFVAVLVKSSPDRPADSNPPQGSAPASTASPSEATVELAESQLNAVKIEPVGVYLFPVEKAAVGSIDYDEDLSVQVFSPYAGKIITALVNLGDTVQKGQSLYTIDSPDLLQAEAALIAAAATSDLTGKEFARAKELYGSNGVSERELEQATSDQQTAQGALAAARDAVRIFGKSEAEMDRIIAERKSDPSLVVASPLAGRVTARNAQPGLLVQPGNAPAPYSVADLSLKWMVANVTESDSPLFHVGQPVQAGVLAWPGRTFDGKISTLGATVDPNTHRLMVRCEIADPRDELRPGMVASFTIRVQDAVESAAIPMNGVVRNGDGTLAAWVTTDRRKFSQRIIKAGLQRDGRYQVLEGLQRGELAVTDGAVFLSNILYAPPTD
ncbi:MAG: efflux RND transporter periplasmic adaptor subunit [Candidatus Brocadiia bacterium]